MHLDLNRQHEGCPRGPDGNTASQSPLACRSTNSRGPAFSSPSGAQMSSVISKSQVLGSVELPGVRSILTAPRRTRSVSSAAACAKQLHDERWRQVVAHHRGRLRHDLTPARGILSVDRAQCTPDVWRAARTGPRLNGPGLQYQAINGSLP